MTICTDDHEAGIGLIGVTLFGLLAVGDTFTSNGQRWHKTATILAEQTKGGERGIFMADDVVETTPPAAEHEPPQPP